MAFRGASRSSRLSVAISTDVPGVTYTYGFDGLGRPISMPTAGSGTSSYISGVTYNEAGQPLQITTGNPQVTAETRAYNNIDRKSVV